MGEGDSNYSNYAIGVDHGGSGHVSVTLVETSQDGQIHRTLLEKLPSSGSGIDYSQVEARLLSALGVPAWVLDPDENTDMDAEEVDAEEVVAALDANPELKEGVRRLLNTPSPRSTGGGDSGTVDNHRAVPSAEELVLALERHPRLLLEVRSLLNGGTVKVGRFKSLYSPPPWGQAVGRMARGYRKRKLALDLWEEYDRAVESHDLTVCSGRSRHDGCGIPANGKERRLSERYAAVQMRNLVHRAVEVGLTREEIEQAKGSNGRWENCRRIIAELRKARGE